MLTRSDTELTTAATDLLLAVVSVWLAWRLAALPTQALWQQQIWTAVLLLLSGGALLGAIVHGIELTGAVRSMLWRPLYFCLGLTVGLVVVGAVGDWLGEPAGRRTLPWAVATSIAFFVLTQVGRSGFALFLVYEGVAMLFALAVYASLALRDQAGAAYIAAGLVVTLLAAAVQASRFSVKAVLRLDHNGLFHLVQLIGVALIASGVRMSLLAR